MPLNKKSGQSKTRKTTVASYSDRGAKAYEDPMNKNFLYGKITTEFIKQIQFHSTDKTVLDVGAGTGFIFDELHSKLKELGIRGIGLEPASGMREIAIEKYKNEKMFTFLEGSFEEISLENKSVDKIVSTLALHWVKSLKVAAQMMRQVLKDDGSLDILMIAKDDGENFKKSIVNALKKHLTFSQIMETAVLVQRVNAKQVKEIFTPYFEGFDIQVENHKRIICGTFDEHMKWWEARSAPVIASVKNKTQFMEDLRHELEQTKVEKGIPFDCSYHWITIRTKA
jgi:ubiquinone/menaquinone biosynthesis C-methylase UbiE